MPTHNIGPGTSRRDEWLLFVVSNTEHRFVKMILWSWTWQGLGLLFALKRNACRMCEPMPSMPHGKLASTNTCWQWKPTGGRHCWLTGHAQTCHIYQLKHTVRQRQGVYKTRTKLQLTWHRLNSHTCNHWPRLWCHATSLPIPHDMPFFCSGEHGPIA